MVQVVKKGKEFDIFYDELATVLPGTRLTGSIKQYNSII